MACSYLRTCFSLIILWFNYFTIDQSSSTLFIADSSQFSSFARKFVVNYYFILFPHWYLIPTRVIFCLPFSFWFCCLRFPLTCCTDTLDDSASGVEWISDAAVPGTRSRRERERRAGGLDGPPPAGRDGSPSPHGQIMVLWQHHPRSVWLCAQPARPWWWLPYSWQRN